MLAAARIGCMRGTAAIGESTDRVILATPMAAVHPDGPTAPTRTNRTNPADGTCATWATCAAPCDEGLHRCHPHGSSIDY